MATRQSKKKSQFKVGDKGYLVFGSRKIPLVVVEDRGFIGVNGRQLLRIREIPPPGGVELIYEVPAEEIVPARRRRRTA